MHNVHYNFHALNIRIKVRITIEIKNSQVYYSFTLPTSRYQLFSRFSMLDFIIVLIACSRYREIAN